MKQPVESPAHHLGKVLVVLQGMQPEARHALCCAARHDVSALCPQRPCHMRGSGAQTAQLHSFRRCLGGQVSTMLQRPLDLQHQSARCDGLYQPLQPDQPSAAAASEGAARTEEGEVLGLHGSDLLLAVLLQARILLVQAPDLLEPLLDRLREPRQEGRHLLRVCHTAGNLRALIDATADGFAALRTSKSACCGYAAHSQQRSKANYRAAEGGLHGLVHDAEALVVLAELQLKKMGQASKQALSVATGLAACCCALLYTHLTVQKAVPHAR